MNNQAKNDTTQSTHGARTQQHLPHAWCPRSSLSSAAAAHGITPIQHSKSSATTTNGNNSRERETDTFHKSQQKRKRAIAATQTITAIIVNSNDCSTSAPLTRKRRQQQ